MYTESAYNILGETLLHAALRKRREAVIESRGANGDGTGNSLRSGRASGDAWNGRYPQGAMGATGRREEWRRADDLLLPGRRQRDLLAVSLCEERTRRSHSGTEKTSQESRGGHRTW